MSESSQETTHHLAISLKAPPAPRDPEERRALAHSYRLRAEILRVVSLDLISEETRVKLLGIAENYDLMATTLEKMPPPNG